jgi:putative ABC transport system permease protein
MALGIVFGMAFVMVLLAIANGFEASQRTALDAYGDRFVLLRLNRAQLDRSASGEERRLMMDDHDVERLRIGAPAIRRLSPMNVAYRARIHGRSGAGAHVYIAGALPEVTKIRTIPLAEGRFYDDLDEAARRRVMVLGPVARKQLFGNGPALGETVRVSGFSRSSIPSRPASTSPQVASVRGTAGRAMELASRANTSSTDARSRDALETLSIGAESFEVIGVLKDIETQKESYVSVARVAFIPFATSTAIFDNRYNIILVEPRTVEDKELAIEQFRRVMGTRYGFGPEDRNAVLVYFDAIERARSVQAIFGGARIFLAAVGVLILGIGGIGVMNVVLLSVASRTFEIGLRKSLGATPFAIYIQFFLETTLACFLSGLLGFGLGAAGIALLSELPLPQNFSQPVLDLQTSLVAFGILAGIALAVGFYPARRAARLSPIEALQAPP